VESQQIYKNVTGMLMKNRDQKQKQKKQKKNNFHDQSAF
jgi:hypothetical protein